MNALVVGAAVSGKYIALLLNKEGYNVILTDINDVSYKKELEAKNIKVIDGGHPDSLLENKYDLVIKNPGIPYDAPFIQKLTEKGYQCVNEVDVALRFVDNYHVAAITGTNGKTTTTILLEKMLKQKYNHAYAVGNIGRPVSEIVYDLPQETVYLACELSSFQLMAMPSFKPKVAAITNLEADHLDYHHDLKEYYNAKQNIYAHQEADDFLLVNIDDENIMKYLKNPKSKVITYSLNKEADVMCVSNKIIYQDQILFSLDDLKVIGNHNIYNAIVASMSALLLGVDQQTIVSVLRDFKGVEHRLEALGMAHNRLFYNDSKSTNVDSTVIALESFDEPVILLVGGHDKQIDLSVLSHYQNKIKAVVSFGETKDKFKDVFKDAYVTDTLDAAFAQAVKISEANDVILLSPACSSFDQYQSFEERGNEFKKLVERYKRG